MSSAPGGDPADKDGSAEDTPAEEKPGVVMARQALAAARAAAVRRGLEPSRAPMASPELRRSPRGPVGADLRSGPGPDDRDPQTLEGALPRLLAAQGWQGRAATAGALDNWAAVVGDDLAAHCVPQRLHKGRLVIEADSTSWATQVRLLAPALLAKLNEHLTLTAGAAAEPVVELKVVGPEAPSWSKGRLSVPGRGPRDTYG